MTTVYVLFHSDIEDDKNIRAVFSTKELAEAELPRDEPSEVGYSRHHSDVCCYIDERELDPAIEAWHGPERPRLPGDPPYVGLVSDATAQAFVDAMLRPLPPFYRKIDS